MYLTSLQFHYARSNILKSVPPMFTRDTLISFLPSYKLMSAGYTEPCNVATCSPLKFHSFSYASLPLIIQYEIVFINI